MSPEIPFQKMTLNQLFELEDRFSATLGGASDILTRPTFANSAAQSIVKFKKKKKKKKKNRLRTK